MKLVKLKGIVIKEINVGEADKIITIFSEKIGKIQALAKGSRRPQNRLIAGTQFLCFSDFILFKNKDLYNIRDCQTIESFYNIRNDLESLTYASHIIDLVTMVSEENLSHQNLLKLTLNSLYMLTKGNKSSQLITRIFEARLMSIIGISPQVIECVNCCKVSSENVSFSARLGGILCSDCISSDKTAHKISNGTLSALRYIIFSDLQKIFSFDVSEDILLELKKVNESFMLEHLNKNFDKLKFLNLIPARKLEEFHNE